MRHFLLFLGGLAAVTVLILNLGPMIILGVSICLLYLIFKQFVKASSTTAKIIWIALGLIVLTISFSNLYALIAVVAVFLLYWIYKNWNKQEPSIPTSTVEDNYDPFMNFEKEWQELSSKKL